MTVALILIAALLVALIVFIASKPDTFRYVRTTVVRAPADKVAALITDFHRWTEWSPYEKLDTAMKKTYGGSPAGVGATYAWESTKAGVGRMEITDVRPEKVTIKLDFSKPMTAHNTAEFLFVPKDGGTEVSWAMFGKQPFMAKAMDLIMNMEKMVAGDFEKGLAEIKRISETQ